MEILLKNGGTYTPSDSDLMNWVSIYKHLDVYFEIEKAAGWCDDHPTRRKVHGRRFVVRWLNNARPDKNREMNAGATRNMTPEQEFSREWAQ